MFLPREKEAPLLVTDVVTKGLTFYISFTTVLENEISLKASANTSLLHDKGFCANSKVAIEGRSDLFAGTYKLEILHVQ